MSNEQFDLDYWMRKPLWPVDAACRLVCGENPDIRDDAAINETNPAKQLPVAKLYANARGALAVKDIILVIDENDPGVKGLIPAKFLEWAEGQGCDVARFIAALPAAKVKAAAAKIESLSLQQENQIINWLTNNKCDPLKLPVPPLGKAGIKKLCKEAVKFSSPSVFDTAWERLRANGKIIDAR